VIDTSKKFYPFYRKYIAERPFECRKCGAVNGSLCRIDFEGNYMFVRVSCNDCANLASIGPYSWEELKQIARLTLKEKGFELSFIIHAFLMVQDYPYLVKDHNTYDLWLRALASDRQIKEGVFE
jgi:hypothetical protein